MIRIDGQELGRLIRAHGGPKVECPAGELDVAGKVKDDMDGCEQWINVLVSKGVLRPDTYEIY